MRKLPSRQVHLDFHTSEHIPDVGKSFDKEQFQNALRLGHLNSITVFAKCHHGWVYYPTQVGQQHPQMEHDFDLTGAMVDAAHEIGVAAPIYITVGWSVHDANQHPSWRMCNEDGTPKRTNIDPKASGNDPRPFCSWENLCPSGDYAQHILAQTEEICSRYPVVDGLFYDIVYLGDTCYCENCLKGIKEAGLDSKNPADAKRYYVQSHLKFMADCEAVLRKYHTEATIFFNSGGADIYRPEYHVGQSHFEMEDLPTAWGGYNKMPPRASFMRRYPKEYLGMTGKFHTSWGEFGGYKHPDALKFEILMMGMYGAKCSVGDQMPPNGLMDLETYRLLGKAYSELERIEPWCYPAKSTTTLGVYLCGDSQSDEGLHNMLLEKQLDFEVVMPGDDLSHFTALILPDSVHLSDVEAARIRDFAAKGGGVLLTGESAIKDGSFQLDAGVRPIGAAKYAQDYLRPCDMLAEGWVKSPVFCYKAAYRTEVTDSEVLAEVYEPWFDRTYEKYCSHKNTPYQPTPADHPAAVRKGNTIYLAHSLCGQYYRDGAQIFRDILINALRSIYTPNLQVEMMSGGRARLTQQPQEKRFVLHLMYGNPIQRGTTSVIEDLPPIYNIKVRVKVDAKVSSITLVPDGTTINFTTENDAILFTVPCVQCHQAIAIQY